MWPVAIGMEEQGWVGGCRVTSARRVNPKTKPFEIPTLHHCQHCPCQRGPGTAPPARPLPTPAVSIWGGTQRGIVPKGTALSSITAALGWDRDRPSASLRGEEGGMEGMGEHGSVCWEGSIPSATGEDGKFSLLSRLSLLSPWPVLGLSPASVSPC